MKLKEMPRRELSRVDIVQLILKAVLDFGEINDVRAASAIDENTVLFGEQGILDSISLLNVVTVIEEQLEERYGLSVDLTSSEAMSRGGNPLQSVGGLANYILGLNPPVTGSIEGEQKIYLRAFEPDDYRQINAWRKDEEIYRLTGGNKRFVSSERDRQWVLEKIANNETEDYLAICLAESGRMIGYISVSNIDYRNSRADWSGIVIGDKECRGQGYASQAIYLLLEYCFDELGLHRVTGYWLSENTVSLFVGRMLGFRQEGVLRDYVYKSGRRHDVILMSVLKPEFEQLRHQFSRSAPKAG